MSNPQKVGLGRARQREGEREGGKDREAEADDGETLYLKRKD